jgi:hypothetical protein
MKKHTITVISLFLLIVLKGAHSVAAYAKHFIRPVYQEDLKWSPVR